MEQPHEEFKKEIMAKVNGINTMVSFILIIIVLQMCSCSSHNNIKAYHASNTLILFINDDMIQVDLEDEQDEYYIESNGVVEKFTFVSGGYSYGKHVGTDYIIWKGKKLIVEQDNGEI